MASSNPSPQKREDELPLSGSGSPEKKECHIPLPGCLITGGRCNTSLWVRHFLGNKANAACDARATPLDGSPPSDRKKKFYQLTREIFLSTSGYTSISLACVARLRSICRAQQMLNPGESLTLEELILTFCSDDDMAKLWFKVTRGLCSSSLLFVSTKLEKSGNMVCKVRALRGNLISDARYEPEFSNEAGAGSGHSVALEILKGLSNDATHEEVKTRVRKAFQAAARKDSFTGGHVLLFEGIDGGWEFVDSDKLTGETEDLKKH